MLLSNEDFKFLVVIGQEDQGWFGHGDEQLCIWRAIAVKRFKLTLEMPNMTHFIVNIHKYTKFIREKSYEFLFVY